MRLSFLNSNVLHQVLSKDTNVVYNPLRQIFDKILYKLDLHFFVFNNNYNSKSSNCLGLPQDYIDLYSYDLVIHNDIVSFSQNNLSRTLHANSIIFEHNHKNPKLKREDIYILNNKLRNVKKVFFDHKKISEWNQQNSILIPYGIPLNVFSNTKDFDERKDIVVYCDKKNIMGKQLTAYLQDQFSIDLIDENRYGSLSLEETAEELNNFKVLINLTSDQVTSLAATACGTNVLDLNQTESPGIINHDSIELIIKTLKEKTQPLDMNKVNDYLTKNHNFETFKKQLEHIIYQTSKKEAYIL